MALRATDHNENILPPLLEVQCFWQEPEKSPTTECKQWVELYEIAMLAQNSISISEIIRIATEQEPHITALLVLCK